MIQPEIIDKSEKYTQKEIEVGVCQFAKTIRRLRLVPNVLFTKNIRDTRKTTIHNRSRQKQVNDLWENIKNT